MIFSDPCCDCFYICHINFHEVVACSPRRYNDKKRQHQILTHSEGTKMPYLAIYITSWRPWLWEILVIVPSRGPTPINIQSVILVPANEWWRGMEEDGAARRSWDALRGGQSVTSLQTPIKLSPQPVERTQSSERGLLETTRTRWILGGRLDRDGDTTGDDFWYSLTLLWIPPENALFSFFVLFATERRGWSKHPARRALLPNRPITSPSASASTRSWEPVQSQRTGARLEDKVDQI